jgi:hypothetical protein
MLINVAIISIFEPVPQGDRQLTTDQLPIKTLSGRPGQKAAADEKPIKLY